MKTRFIKALILKISLLGALNIFNMKAQVPGKPYQIGDTIVMDNMLGMVYKIDETGLHGAAMSLNYEDKIHLKAYGSLLKNQLKKKVKNGEICQEQMENELDLFYNRVPPMTTQKIKGGLIYSYKTWSTSLPEGWRLPTASDAEDIIVPFTGGIGQDYSIGGLSGEKLIAKVTADFSFKWALKGILPFGFIIEDNDRVAFVHNISKKAKQWFIITDKYKGNEMIIAVKDF